MSKIAAKSSLEGYTGQIPWRLRDIYDTIWLTRPDLRKLSQGDREWFEWWLLLNGAKEYRALAEANLSMPSELLEQPAENAHPDVQPPLTRFMERVLQMRPDLQDAFDIRTAEGQRSYLWWFFIHGAGELGLARFFTADQRRFLNEADPRLPQDTILPIVRVMAELWSRRPDLQKLFPLGTKSGRTGFLFWFYATGIAETGLLEVIDEVEARSLLATPSSTDPVPRIVTLLWSGDTIVRQQFPDATNPEFRAWTRGPGQDRFPVLRRLAEVMRPPKPIIRRAPINLPFGVNLIGYARGQFGIGEDVRMAALAMQAAGIPFAVHNIEPGREVCQGDDSLSALITDKLPYAINMFCTTGFETARLAAMEGSRLFDGRRSIGYWPWELPMWPKEWWHAYNLIDEVWASSRYTYQAYVDSSPKPVRHMPMAVTVEATAGMTRRDFGLPDGRFLFTFSFDMLSSVARKNPDACINAFRRAFPRGDEPVGLVVKVMRASPENALWQGLVEDARLDARIVIISETLSRPAVLDLYRACDAFVSLHRAEGFGRGIAEAMMLGKPVIVTGYSGNMDFTVSGTAALVDHRLRPVAADEYPFGTGLLWAEPDVEHAAWWMRRLVEDVSLRDRLARQGRDLATATYSPSVVGAGYAAVLRETIDVPVTKTCFMSPSSAG